MGLIWVMGFYHPTFYRSSLLPPPTSRWLHVLECSGGTLGTTLFYLFSFFTSFLYPFLCQERSALESPTENYLRFLFNYHFPIRSSSSFPGWHGGC